MLKLIKIFYPCIFFLKTSLIISGLYFFLKGKRINAIFADMKWIAIVMSIYLMALSNMPCADMEVNSAMHKTARFSSEENHSHDKDNDLCSPFCACNCCGAQVLSYQTSPSFEFSSVYTKISIPLPSYNSVFTSNFYGSIWQPPQIS